MCVGGVLTTELLSVNITIRAVQRSSRGGSPGGGRDGGREEKEWRSAGSETEERLSACTIALLVWQAAL